MASFQVNLAKYFLRQLRAQSLGNLQNLTLFRIEQDKALGRLRPPKNIRHKADKIGHLKAEWSFPSKDKYNSPKVILYLHGGGYAVGSIESHRGLVGKIVSETGIPAILVEYRLAPEHPFPAALDDSLLSYHWLIEQKGYHPKDIILMGDSAGGGLSLSTLLKLKELDLEQPLCSVLYSPWTDLSMSGDSVFTHQDKDPILLADEAKKWASWYFSHLDPAHPNVSPLFGDLSNIAPTLVQVGTDEIFLSDSLRLIEAAKCYNAPIKVDIWDSMFHVWHFAWPYVPESRQAITEVALFIDRAITGDVYRNPLVNPLKAEEKEKQDLEKHSSSWLRMGNDFLKNIIDNK